METLLSPKDMAIAGAGCKQEWFMRGGNRVVKVIRWSHMVVKIGFCENEHTVGGCVLLRKCPF